MGQNNRYTRAGAGIFGIADGDAVNVGNQISWTRSYHKVTKSKIMILVNRQSRATVLNVPRIA
jgi:hypothetical protein